MRVTVSTAAMIFVALALPTFALVGGLPAHPKYFAVLNNAAHAPVFGAYTFIVAILLRRHSELSVPWQYIAAFGIAVLTGGFIELIQPAIGREAELADIWTDLLGATAALSLLAIPTSRRRWLPSAFLGIAIVGIGWPLAETVLAYHERNRQAPELLELSGKADWFFIWTQGLEASEERLPNLWTRPNDPVSVSLMLTSEPLRTIGHVEPIADWRNYRRLMVDLTNPGPKPLQLTLRVHDRIHNDAVTDRFNRSFVIEAATRRVVAISVADIARAPFGRMLDLSQVAAWMIFVRDDSARAGQMFYLTRIWLE